MLPGLDGTGELFEHFVKHLPLSINPVICTYPPDAALGYDQLREFAQGFVPSGEPYVILGESFSGPIAIRLASQESDLLKGLVLVNTFVSCPRPTLARVLPFTPNILLSKPPSFLINYMFRKCEAQSSAKEKVAEVVKGLEASLVRSRLNSIREVDVSRHVCEITVPVCILQSLSDTFIPRRSAKQLNSIFMDAERIMMSSDHFMLQAFPRSSAIEISQFCSKVERALVDES